MLLLQLLRKGDHIAVVSLSSGIMGEPWCAHEKELRAADLKAAFLDDSIKGIICALGGMDTFRAERQEITLL